MQGKTLEQLGVRVGDTVKWDDGYGAQEYRIGDIKGLEYFCEEGGLLSSEEPKWFLVGGKMTGKPIDLSPILPHHSDDRDAIALDILKAFCNNVNMFENAVAFAEEQSTTIDKAIATLSFKITDAFLTARVAQPQIDGVIDHFDGVIDHFDGVAEGLREAVTIGEEAMKYFGNASREGAAVQGVIDEIKGVIEARK